MRSLFIISFLVFLMAACNQNNTTQQPVNNDLIQLENDWMHAMMKKDQAALNQLMATEFTMSGMKYIDSPVVSRNMWMRNTMNDLKIDSVHFVNIKVKTVNDVGIVRSYLFWSGSYDEDHFSDTSLYIDTWIKKENGWQVMSRITTE